MKDLRGARTQVNDLIERTEDHEQADTIRAAGEALADGVTELEGELSQPKQKTFQDVINFENRLNAKIIALIASVDGTPPPVVRGAADRLDDLLAEWSEKRNTMNDLFRQIDSFNRLIQELGVPPIVVNRSSRRVISATWR
ncbi:MAG: hypothetical protein IID06_01405 [Gemmatimonadetes bacterium]|nr:hypothetical protein [Gemmatimonadota bacterium]